MDMGVLIERLTWSVRPFFDRYRAWRARPEPVAWVRDVAARSILRNEENSEAERATLAYFTDLFRQRATAGQIVVYGKRLNLGNGPEEAIPTGYWQDWTIDVDSLLDSRLTRHASTKGAVPLAYGGLEYGDLRIKKSAARQLLKDTWKNR